MFKTRPDVRRPVAYFRACTYLTILLIVQGCASDRAFMPTPNLFKEQNSYTAEPDHQASDDPRLELLYVTDRGITDQTDNPSDKVPTVYGNTRSASAAFGVATVGLGSGVDWESLTVASAGVSRKKPIVYGNAEAVEYGRYPESPYLFSLLEDRVKIDPKALQELEQSNTQFRQLITSRLQRNKTNDVVLFIHGFNNSFEYAAQTLAGISHFLERRQVPLLYSWPAGVGGIRGYFIDRVSGQFTIFHLKETLRTLIETPEIENIYIIAHSRGTDVITTALRELLIERRNKDTNAKQALRIANLILAAPDLDYGVVRQRLMAERFGSGFGSITVYTTATDKALTIAQLLMKGIRFGLLASDNIDKRDKSILQNVGNVSFVLASDIKSLTGHDYFFSDPAVSSDLLTVINHSATPGSPLRPLRHQGGNFWLLDENYPEPAKEQ